MSRGSEVHGRKCDACAEICERCAHEGECKPAQHKSETPPATIVGPVQTVPGSQAATIVRSPRTGFSIGVGKSPTHGSRGPDRRDVTVASRALRFHHFSENGDDLTHCVFAAMFGIFEAALQVIAEEDRCYFARAGHRGCELLRDFETVTIRLNHLLNPPDLPFDLPQPAEELRFVLFIPVARPFSRTFPHVAPRCECRADGIRSIRVPPNGTQF